jgi:hypothetical protein
MAKGNKLADKTVCLYGSTDTSFDPSWFSIDSIFKNHHGHPLPENKEHDILIYFPCTVLYSVVRDYRIILHLRLITKVVFFCI